MHNLQNPLSNSFVVSIDKDVVNNDFFTANLNPFNSTSKGITVLPTLEGTIAQLKEGGFKNIKSTKFIPGSELYGIVVGSQSLYHEKFTLKG
jgi:hypothetical protein